MPTDVKAIFLVAADLPIGERAAYLVQACGNDSGIRRRVEALLKAHDDSDGWLGEPATPTSDYPGFTAPGVEELAPLFPQLEIIALLGQGGMGVVYKARQKNLDRFVALKILPHDSGDKGFAERFAREARTLARLNHPGIVAVHDFGTSAGMYWFVMEYVDGVNLRQAKKAGTLTPAAALAIVPKICEALQFAHDAGIVHRDIKPENVLLDAKGRVKIADFGLAKLIGRIERPNLTGTHQAMGTPHYMAPEQWERPLDVDHRADIYSLGVVFYELLTGELPLGRFDPPSKKVQIDVRLDEVVLRTLEKEPDRRYQHASEVKTDVERIGAAAAPVTVSETPLSSPEKSKPDGKHCPACGVDIGVWPSFAAIQLSHIRCPKCFARIGYRQIAGVWLARLLVIGPLLVTAFFAATFIMTALGVGVGVVASVVIFLGLATLFELVVTGYLREHKSLEHWSSGNRKWPPWVQIGLLELSNWGRALAFSANTGEIFVCFLGVGNAFTPWLRQEPSNIARSRVQYVFDGTSPSWGLIVSIAFLVLGVLLFVTARTDRLRPWRNGACIVTGGVLLALTLYFITTIGGQFVSLDEHPLFYQRGLGPFAARLHMQAGPYIAAGLSALLLLLGAIDLRGWLTHGRDVANRP